MAKLYFRYGAMGSSKTANVLMTAYNYEEKGRKVALLKPALENRDGAKTIKSRIGLADACDCIEDFIKENLISTVEEIKSKYDVIIIDESQFMTREQVDFFADIVDKCNINVLCYGLRADFQNELFEGSQRLLTIADEIEEIKTICWCGEKATCNARYNENGIVREGSQVELGANDKYVSVCRKHFKEGKLKP